MGMLNLDGCDDDVMLTIYIRYEGYWLLTQHIELPHLIVKHWIFGAISRSLVLLHYCHDAEEVDTHTTHLMIVFCHSYTKSKSNEIIEKNV